MTVHQVPAEGFATPGFEAVRDAFSLVFAADGELGTSLGVYADGEKRVDLQGGLADPATGRPWGLDMPAGRPHTRRLIAAVREAVSFQLASLTWDRHSATCSLAASLANYQPSVAAHTTEDSSIDTSC